MQTHPVGESWHREPGRGRYAQPERERRFLLDAMPTGLGPPREIVDLYVEGTTLRVRRVTGGSRTTFKLTQKVRSDAGDPAETALTNTYLSEAEYALLTARLPGSELIKTRRTCTHEGLTLAVDEFHGALDGLLLAEVEAEQGDAPMPLPHWLGPEVTHDDRYSGGTLARCGRPSLQQPGAGHPFG